ncbi:MerR family transcriptional regulator [Corynebacterium aurimucosum]|uniref:MerR family transcriptional regulator n=1 Tax=Corynebacterium aurimucosum TaxID=169292 RepID=A0A558GHB9_9CORY|nr:MerR family transcriptional regulator [Corynebacterium sp. HMSC062A03]OFP21636.1 MerR family transcriptional regulator [Corynebacterium sp. HMSC066C02]OFQ34933.1 MerR family transcriptional regulator [Corynebacterium sp. HMSC072D12]OFS40896.1 MerR family transcriptional regulator [Corynebacterium sp. HMSC069E04]OFT66384.1 MerR family transcriptional regulator [Corynebacterium sp. HMSC05D03]TVU56270.1 MerR family transcriptional regulator [Corynebacterium aurimucosum]
MSSKNNRTESSALPLDEIAANTYVQESLFDVGPDEELGYRVPIACQVAGITYRQLDYWARTDLVKPSIRTARGSGSQRLYSFKDVLVLKIVKRLLDTGISLQNIRLAVESLRDRGVNDLAELTLVSDGTTVYECRSNDEVIDLLAGGQGVFGIAVPGILKELSGTITSFPAERVVEEEDIDVVIGLDELAARRKRKTS